jgi:acyl-CoA thioesterase-1
MTLKNTVLFFCIFSLLVCGCSPEKKIKNINSTGYNIVCFGNSLTWGMGASAGNDYPALLARHLPFPVINAGRSGDTTEDALKRIARDVLNQNPRLVIVELGSNDFLRGIDKEKTAENLEQIVKQIQDAGAMVALVEVRTELIGQQQLSELKRIARQRQTLLIPNILRGIITDPGLKSDPIHPNDAGYKIMAERILKVIKRVL